MVGRCDEHAGHELLHQERTRVVFGAHTALFFDHLQLGEKLFVGPVVVGKAVSLQAHDFRQAGRRNLLVVAREIPAGEGVFLSAQLRHTA